MSSPLITNDTPSPSRPNITPSSRSTAKRRKLSAARFMLSHVSESQCGSDTETDEYAEAMAEEYLNAMPRDAPVSPTPQQPEIRKQQDHKRSRVEINDEPMLDFNPTISAPANEMKHDAKAQIDASDESIKEESSDDEIDVDVHYPVLPSLCSTSLGYGLGQPQHLFPSNTTTPQDQSQPAPTILPQPRPASLRTPTGYHTNYRPRCPTDTQFHRGSAGIDPLGAYNRPATVDRNPLLRGNNAGAGCQHRIVSGSFGSFGPSKPSRFDEREYRLFPESAGAASGEKRKRVGAQGVDPFKGKPWLRKG